MPRALSLLLVLLATLARAQAPEPAPPLPPLPAAAPEDRRVELTDDDLLLYGNPPRQVTPVELFQALGRQDLVDRARANAARRLGLFIAAGVLAAGAVAVAAALWATAPEMGGTSRCNSGDLAYYNTVCQPQWVLHTQGGTFALVGGLAAAGVLATFALFTRPDVFTPFELQQFIREHNASLAWLRLTPWLSPAGAGLAARAAF